jgi:23S rRNA pseudouridine2605 synthase
MAASDAAPAGNRRRRVGKIPERRIPEWWRKACLWRQSGQYGGKPQGTGQSSSSFIRPASPGPARPAPEPINKLEGEGERVAKLLARAGMASRREVERLIEAGRVKVGDITITTPATLLTTLKGVTVDGNPVKAPEAARLYAFHKPSGLITAERDPAGRRPSTRLCAMRCPPIRRA